MNAGFEKFRNLYNNRNANPISWDIELLKKEQSVLQKTHEKYLNKKYIIESIKYITDSDNDLPLVNKEKQQTQGGLDVLDINSRIRYGCKLLGYTEQQGCKP